MAAHNERKHSKFSASGAERWQNCPGSVALSEGLPDKPNKYSEEGTKAHEVLEQVLKFNFSGKLSSSYDKALSYLLKEKINKEMGQHAIDTATFIYSLKDKISEAELLVETRIFLDFIHPEMFGTFDSAIVDHFGTLHVMDYKYGKSTVSPVSNLQMIFYAMGLAHQYKWNFKKARMWIIQPRADGFDGPVFWDLTIQGLLNFVHIFKEAVERVEKNPHKFAEGSWCHWCRAKGICPLKNVSKNKKAIALFNSVPIMSNKRKEK